MKRNKKGFTLAELLIVIAIIAILIAIAIPAFSGQLDNAKLQADHSNLRSAYAVCQTINLLGASSDTIDGYTAGTTLSATYGTDGRFHNTTTSPVKMQAADGKHTGPSGTSETCKACVVDCSKFATKDAEITIVAYKDDTTAATATDKIALWKMEPVTP